MYKNQEHFHFTWSLSWLLMSWWCKEPVLQQQWYWCSSLQAPGSCFTNVSRALQNNLAKIYKARNNIYAENFKLKLGTCVQSMALGTRTKFQLEILIRSMILVIYKFLENILESSRNVSETPPWIFHEFKQCMCQECISQVLWLISNDVVQKQMVYNSLMIHCLIMITGISHENKIWFQH